MVGREAVSKVHHRGRHRSFVIALKWDLVRDQIVESPGR
jgi:hypothetical protein